VGRPLRPENERLVTKTCIYALPSRLPAASALKDKYSVADESTNLLLDGPGRPSSEEAAPKKSAPAIEDQHAPSGQETLESYKAFLQERGWLDVDFYVLHYPDVLISGLSPEEHFWRIGFIEGRSPNFYFDSNWYLATNPGVKTFGKPALYHYALHGDSEGRKPSEMFDTEWYRTKYKLSPEQNALLHYLSHRTSGDFCPVPQFDAAFYRRINPEVAAIDPFEQFVVRGYNEGRDPLKASDVEAYWGRYLRGPGEINPLLSYIANRNGSDPLAQTPTHEKAIRLAEIAAVDHELLPALRGGTRTLPDSERQGNKPLDETHYLFSDRVGVVAHAGAGESDQPGLYPSITYDGFESSRLAKDPAMQDAVVFDEDDYLVAFPELAIAISAGTYKSATQHYIEHGKRENRLAQDRYRQAVRGRQVHGHIDFYGHNSRAGGWIFCGWTSQAWDENDAMSMVAHFENGDVSGECFSVHYRRRHLKEGGTGLVFFIQGSSEPLGRLISVAARSGRVKMTISAEPGGYQLDSQTIASETRSILVNEQWSDNSRELLLLLSAGGYGRFHRMSLNTLEGFIDFYGYHAASGKWWLCGWTTRCWDKEVGPERLTLHFGDDDIVIEDILAGFYPREDIEGKGVGFLIAVRGPDRPLGTLISVTLHLGDLSSFCRHRRPSGVSGRLI